MNIINRLTLFVVLSVIAFAPGQKLQAQTSNNFEIAKNLDIFATMYKELNTNYVDELKSGELIKTGIDAMLESLDPYTVYIPEAEI